MSSSFVSEVLGKRRSRFCSRRPNRRVLGPNAPIACSSPPGNLRERFSRVKRLVESFRLYRYVIAIEGFISFSELAVVAFGNFVWGRNGAGQKEQYLPIRGLRNRYR